MDSDSFEIETVDLDLVKDGSQTSVDRSGAEREKSWPVERVTLMVVWCFWGCHFPNIPPHTSRYTVALGLGPVRDFAERTVGLEAMVTEK